MIVWCGLISAARSAYGRQPTKYARRELLSPDHIGDIWEQIRRSGITEHLTEIARSFRLDAGKLDDLGPLFGFVGDELFEVRRRAGEHRAAEISEPRLHPRIGEAGVDLLVELLDDLGRRVARGANAVDCARLVAGQSVAYSR